MIRLDLKVSLLNFVRHPVHVEIFLQYSFELLELN
jgi:hypothetical protein